MFCPLMNNTCIKEKCEFWSEKNNIAMCSISLGKDLIGCAAGKLIDIENLLFSINKKLVKQSSKMPKLKEKKKTTKKSR